MAHPLYHHALKMVGRPVYAHHLNGTVYHGILHSATPTGVYLMNSRSVARMVHFEAEGVPSIAEQAVQVHSMSTELVYSPGAYFAFGALAGLSLGAFASPFLW